MVGLWENCPRKGLVCIQAIMAWVQQLNNNFTSVLQTFITLKLNVIEVTNKVYIKEQLLFGGINNLLVLI